MPRPITSLPPGYAETRQLIATEEKRLLWLNLLAFIPLALSGIAMFGWWLLVNQLRGEASQAEFPVILGVLLLLLVLPLHEGIHAVAIAGTGHRPRIGAKLDKGVLYATADGAYFRRGEFIVIALAPVVVITLGGMLLMLAFPGWPAFWFGLTVAVNAGSSIGDFWMADAVFRASSAALVRDEADGIRIFTPTAPQQVS